MEKRIFFNQWLYQLDLIRNSFSFFRNHFLLISVLGIIAGVGRVMQLGGFGPINAETNMVLEVIIQSSRVMLFVYVLGLSDLKKGFLSIIHFFSARYARNTYRIEAVNNLKRHWKGLLLNFIAFSCIAFTLNMLIDQLAYQTCILLKLKTDGILHSAATEWTILLFFKNIWVIPFTLVFETLLLKKITHRWTNSGLTK